MSRVVYIGIDDTDIIGSIGTGRVARGVAERIMELGMGLSLGVTRHQLLVDPRIPYTSHNSSLCAAMETDAQISDLAEPSVAYLKKCFQEGSDPGICIMTAEQSNKELAEFGHRAEREVLTKSEALTLAEKHNLYIRELGGTGGGVIGALAAVALRIDGNGGRFVDLNGIREISGLVTVGELKRRTDIAQVVDSHGNSLEDNELINSQDWVRPTLVGGRPMLRVENVSLPDIGPVWVSVERKSGKSNRERSNQ